MREKVFPKKTFLQGNTRSCYDAFFLSNFSLIEKLIHCLIHKVLYFYVHPSQYNNAI